MSFKGILFLGTAVAICLPVVQAQAVQPVSEATGDVGIADIVVTARRTSENVQDVPLSVSAFGAESLRELGIDNLPDVAQQTPGLQLNRSANDPTGANIAIRGQYSTDLLLTLDPAVGVYIDGVNLPKSLGISAALLDVARIEVLKGPQGTLFGKNTTGGAISITSAAPNLAAVEGYVDLRLGNYALRELSGAISIPLVADTLAIRVAGKHSEHKGYGEDLQGRDVDDDNTETWRGRLAWRPTDALSVDLSVDYTRFDNGGPATHVTYVTPYSGTGTAPSGFQAAARELGLPATPAGFAQARDAVASYIRDSDGFRDNQTNLNQYARFKSYGVAADIGYELTDDIRVRSITANRWLLRDNDQDVDGTPFTLSRSKVRVSDEVFSQELQLLGSLTRLDWIIGGYYAKEHGNETGQSFTTQALNPNAPTLFDGDVGAITKGVFAQGTYSLTPALRFTGGVRYTKERKTLLSRNRNSNPNPALRCILSADARPDPTVCESFLFSRSFSAFSYLASVDWHFQEDMMVYAKTSRGFRGGGNNLRGTSLASFGGFEPESVTDYEVGAKLDLLDRRLRINVAAYTSKLLDAQRSRQTLIIASPPTSATVIDNAASVRTSGIELEVTAVPVEGLTLNGTFGYIRSKYLDFVDETVVGGVVTIVDRTAEPIPIPKKTYSFTATYEVPVGPDKLRLTGNVTGRSSSVLAVPALLYQTVSSRPYALVNGRITYTSRALDADVALWAENIFKKEYASAAVSFTNPNFGFNTRYPGAPRTFGIQLTKRFGVQ